VGEMWRLEAASTFLFNSKISLDKIDLQIGKKRD